ncbi:MAG: cysteine hydrolase [Burkholderiaceae bacterium]
MNRLRLLIIDPQNDFMDIAGATLPVPGAEADMQRVAGLVRRLQARIDDIVVTLDSHNSIGIERVTFWQLEGGGAVPPFSAVTAANVRAGRFAPRDAHLRQGVLEYLDALEAGSGRTLIVWPVHCVIGSWGHNIHADLYAALADWEFARMRPSEKVLKGTHPMTEQYSAFRAEVPRADDIRTQNNATLMARVGRGDELLLVAGEALSHCVAASGDDMLAQLDAQRLRRTVFLTDCMSPVTGFSAQGEEFLERARKAGARTISSAEWDE